MTIIYLIGENSIWQIKDIELLKQSLEDDQKFLTRIIREDESARGYYIVEYPILTLEEFYSLQRSGADILLYYKEDVMAQIIKLEKEQSIKDSQ